MGLRSQIRRIITGQTHFNQLVELKSLVNSFKMLLVRPGCIEDIIAKDKTWEPNLTSLMCLFMSDGRVFLDIGSNIGFHSLFVASSFENSNCIAFEPNPLIYEQLIRNIKLNDHLPNITVYDIAISNSAGEIDFYIQDSSCYNRGLSSTLYNYDLNGVKKARVKTQPLDDLLDDSTKSKIAVIKIDTQGNELEVILGAINTIGKSKPVIFFEFETDYHPENAEVYFNAILDALTEYKIFSICRDGPKSFQEFSVSEICKTKGFEGDFICLPDRFFQVKQRTEILERFRCHFLQSEAP